jgi:hypothetical protein
VRVEKNITVDIGSDSTYILLESRVGGAHIIWFNTEPAEADVAFTVTGRSGGVLDLVKVGRSGTRQMGKSFTLTRGEAQGLPDGFADYRAAATPTSYVWWLGGRRTARPGEATSLTAEEKKRLKALGYIQ